MQCPRNAFPYNGTLCSCNPGHVLDAARRSCSLLAEWGPIEVDSGVDHKSAPFPRTGTVFASDSIRKLTQSQDVFIEGTLILVLSWLAFCFLARFAPLGDGRSLWFKIRWSISRLDGFFSTSHWLDDQKVVKKRKTELGGTFSTASWILFVGLFAALLYQIISKRAIEVHNVRATNAPELEAFRNDLEFNVTTISSMTCAHLRGLKTVASGNPGFLDYRVAPLSTFASYSCINTTRGPTIVLKCTNCPLTRDNAFISWQFIDLPNDPATAVGFQFNLTARNPENKKHMSFVSGTLRNGSNVGNKRVTYRGPVSNMLQFNIVPRIYRNMDGLSLVQPLFHGFLPGSFFSEVNQLKSSLQNSNDGLINTTLYINFLSSYIVQVENENIMGPVSFLADLGGLFCISIVVFFYMLVQCESRIKRLRNEDSVMQRIRSRRRAQDRWDKLRKYVMFKWDPSVMRDKGNNVRYDGCCLGVSLGTLHKEGPLPTQREKMGQDTVSFSKKGSLPENKTTIMEPTGFQMARLTPIPEKVSSFDTELKNTAPHVKDGEVENNVTMHSTSGDLELPPLPSLEFHASQEVSLSNLQKNIESLYEYNALLREKLIAAELTLRALSKQHFPSTSTSHGSSCTQITKI
ncbi:hypothetical protein DM860_006394 [Cuscuta australis]|uniref:Uncharacterized protein n=1 Tax=Cuscuta australis TaxID=267555 RepID=A0A328D4I7_9ASTE|nr:hypothetical protein DM860_006394 [Cuscuta australis]